MSAFEKQANTKFSSADKSSAKMSMSMMNAFGNINKPMLESINRMSTAMDGFRIVMAFGTGPNTQKMCSLKAPSGPDMKAQGGASASQNIVVDAVLCDQDKPLTAISGRVGGVSQPDDPRFAELMKQIALGLFPAENDWKS